MRQVHENNAGHHALSIKTALDNLPDADKASGKDVFGKTREVIAEVRGKLGETLATSIANALKLKHIISEMQLQRRPGQSRILFCNLIERRLILRFRPCNK